MRLFITIILDGVGIGELPDSAEYGDTGSDTLGHVCEHRLLNIPNLSKLGLGRIRSLNGIEANPNPSASFGKMKELSAGKDSTTGHWELAGLLLDQPFPTYPGGFPKEVIDSFLVNTHCSGVLGNKAISGTTIVAELGEEHAATGYPILYTSADSVFQIAAHIDVIPLDGLYEMCSIARKKVCIGDHAVGRVIARPFEGDVGHYARISPSRKDFSLLPTAKTVVEALQDEDIVTVSIGKIFDLLGGIGFSESLPTTSNADGIRKLVSRISQFEQDNVPTFIWINLVDFDQEYGHRNNPEGFAGALEEFDLALPEILRTLPDDGRIVITADHGNDPTTRSTDHSREYVPLLYYGLENVLDLGIRSSFRDHAVTVANYFDIPFDCHGISFE